MADLSKYPYPQIRAHLPVQWADSTSASTCNIEVLRNTVEYDDVVQHFTQTPKRVVRHQNMNQYGLFLIRQQQLQVLEPHTRFFKVTRFCTINLHSVDKALKFNLDSRRLSEQVIFQTSPSVCTYSNVVLIVSAIVEESFVAVANFTPQRDADLYIEYVVYFQ